MPIRTPIYGLEAFTEGEEYSASTDQRRFLIIDNQLAYFTDIIGEGRIIGWEVTHFEPNEYRPLSLSISAGIGIIGRFVTFTYGDYEIDLDDNHDYKNLNDFNMQMNTNEAERFQAVKENTKIMIKEMPMRNAPQVNEKYKNEVKATNNQ